MGSLQLGQGCEGLLIKIVFLSAPENEEALSSTSEEADGEDMELQAASEHLTQDFLSQVIQEVNERQDKRQGSCNPEVESENKVTHLSTIQETLLNTASLCLQETFHTLENSGMENKVDSEHFMFSKPLSFILPIKQYSPDHSSKARLSLLFNNNLNSSVYK